MNMIDFYGHISSENEKVLDLNENYLEYRELYFKLKSVGFGKFILKDIVTQSDSCTAVIELKTQIEINGSIYSPETNRSMAITVIKPKEGSEIYEVGIS